MKYLLAILVALVAILADASEYITGVIRPGERIFLTEKPCIVNGTPYYSVSEAAKHVMRTNRFVQGCYVTRGDRVFFQFNDGDEGWIPARELELGGTR